MTTELVPVPIPRAVDAIPVLGPVDVLAAFLAGRNPRTLRAYMIEISPTSPGSSARSTPSPPST
jgi:hypothetical protein